MHGLSSNLVLLPVMAGLLAAAGVPLVKRLARHVDAMATPVSVSRHHKAIPLLGGVAIIGAFLGALALTASLPLLMLISTLTLMAVGILDDIFALRPVQKLAGQIAVSLGVIVFAGPQLAILNNQWLDSVVVFAWLIATTNAFNLLDGLDGLAGGTGAVTTLAVAATALLHHNPTLAVWSLTLTGALCGFLVYNFHPASIFMGDAGALPVGFMLGIFTLQAGKLGTSSRLIGLVFPLLLMLVPILDTSIVTATRLATGRPISRRGLDHTHHRLLSLGLPDRTVALVCWAVALLAAACAVGMSVLAQNYLVVMLPFVLLPPALVGLFLMDLTFDSRPPGIAYGYLPRIARLILRIGYKLRIVEALLDAMLIAAAYFGAFLIRLDFKISASLAHDLVKTLPWVLAASYSAFVATGVYRGMWRYTGMADAVRFANGALAAGVGVLVLSWFVPLPLGRSNSLILLLVILLFNLLLASRMSFRLLRKASARFAVPITRVLIIGAGRLGAAAGKDLNEGQGQERRVCLVGFVDNDEFKHHKLVAGSPVLGSLQDLEPIFQSTAFNEILVAVDTLDDQRLDPVWNFANCHNVVVRRFSILTEEAAPVAAPREANGRVVTARRITR